MKTVMFEDRAWIVLPNTAPELRIGNATEIFQDPITRQISEGIAIIREIDTARSTPDRIEARIEFIDEPGESYSRSIYRQ